MRPALKPGVQVVPDPNVLVSAAAAPDGVCGKLLDLLARSPLELVTSPLLVAEVSRVLARPTFRAIGDAERAAYLEYVRRIALVEADPPAGGGALVAVDPGDDYLVRLTLAAPERILVSGDPHLLALAGTYPVVSPRALLDRLLASEQRRDR